MKMRRGHARLATMLLALSCYAAAAAQDQNHPFTQDALGKSVEDDPSPPPFACWAASGWISV